MTQLNGRREPTFQVLQATNPNGPGELWTWCNKVYNYEDEKCNSLQQSNTCAGGVTNLPVLEALQVYAILSWRHGIGNFVHIFCDILFELPKPRRVLPDESLPCLFPMKIAQHHTAGCNQEN